MTTIILDRSDINTALHPNLWRELCEELDLPEDSETIILHVARAEGE